MKHLQLLVLVALTALLWSCSAKKQATGGVEPAPAAGTPQAAYRAMVDTYTPWHTVQVPVKASLSGSLPISASGRLTMVRDSLVHVSLRVLGMEVGVLRATTDSVWVVNKVQRQVQAAAMRTVQARTGLGLADLQALLLGRAFVPGHGQATAATAKALRMGMPEAGTLEMTPATNLPYNLLLTATDGALTAVSVDAPGYGAASMAITPGAGCPQSIYARGRVGKRSLEATLTMAPRSIAIDAPGLSIPSAPNLRGYSR